MKKPWGGRFKEATDDIMVRFSASIGYDQRLYAYDIQGSIAHCKMLAKCKVIKSTEAKKIVSGLQKILKEFESGTFVCDEKLEDIHMNIERRLIDLIGPVGGKLHTGRSRNDQVCLDFRLFLRAETEAIVEGITRLSKAFLAQARKNVDTIVPGYTHLQRAQPVRLAHHLLAYVEMLLRDRDRFLDAYPRINVMPLGSAALAGTNFPLDREYTAKLLGFPEISHNSMDAVGDRDFAIEFCSASAILMAHLSRFCEEIILWCSSEFDWVELSDAFTTGSSIMPQKKNPDAAELTRGKSGRVFGNLMALLTLLKSLPMAYNRDLQEDKEPVFDTVDTVKSVLDVMTGMLKTARFKKPAKADLEAKGFLTATDMADYLVLQGVPFREAHEITGKAVAYCLEQNKPLGELGMEELKTLWPRFREDVYGYLQLESSVDRKDVYGGPSKRRVQARINQIDKKLKTSRSALFKTKGRRP